MLGGGGIKAAAKRTAFGDVSNTFNVARPSKDDSTIPTKLVAQVASKPTLALQEKKSAAFLRPAQRPLSVSSLKGLLTGAAGVGANDQTTRQTAVEVSSTSQAANTRKVLTKRNTTIFKDSSLDTVEEIVPQAPSHTASVIPTAQPSQAVSKSIPSLRPTKEEAVITKEPTKESTKLPSKINTLQVNETKVNTTTTSSEAPDTEALRSDGIYIDDRGDLRVYQEEIEGTQEVPQPVATKAPKSIPAPSKSESIEMTTKVAAPLHAMQPALPRYVQAAPSEPEEYWNDEEEDNYDEEGYVTAQSYRSRGENTTGGATTVLFPHANQKVKREIAAAKQLVEATRTAEEIEDECFDTSMVAEYGEEIFDYMKQLEVCSPFHLFSGFA